MMKKITGILVSALALATSWPTAAHDIRAIADPAFASEPEVTEADIEAALRANTDVGGKYVIERATLWTPGQTIHACFFGGDSGERSRVKDVATELFAESSINLKLSLEGDCAKDASGRYPSEFRISLQNGCCSAYVGRQSLVGNIAKGPSIFIAGAPPKATIKHEFIHALGFHHEHQKPPSPCNFLYDRIAAAFGWTPDMVVHNFERLEKNSHKYIWDAGFDVESIMKYYFDPQFLAEGKSSPCYYSQVYELSSGDINGLKRAYPSAFDFAAHKAKLASKATVAVPASSPLKAVLAAFPND
jgi:hypothetical protein